jgi:AraC-like DNA-binding protein
MSFFYFFKEFFLKYRQSEPTIKSVFDHYFFDSKYYLQSNASRENFSSLLNINSDHLDKISKMNYDCFFETLLNEYRYKHLLKELESPINSFLTIESILKLSGFENNSKFIAFVKSKNNSVLESHSFNN